jgi:hydrogenase-4 transcriptional activator
MTEAADILRSYVRLVERLSGAASVSLFVPPVAVGEREILLHEGRMAPVPELADEAAAAELQRTLGDDAVEPDAGAVRVASRDPSGVLYRIPVGWVLARPETETGGPERRRGESRTRQEVTAWIGLRFDKPTEAGREHGLLDVSAAAGTLSDEHWWKGFLGLAAAFAAHARTVSRTLFDQVTGLPQRPEFQTRLELALVESAERKVPVILLLLGPENFGWVNERLDRRSGDLVLGEIAAVVRGGLRSRDHVARYGGATFAVILFDTAADGGRMVAANLVRRLDEQRYHGGMLRLDFGAGVAATDGTESIDAHEMIRRADQALSAARRDDGGRVRLWEKGSDVEKAGSLDRLQGIFTGDKAKDYRNMRLLLDSVAVVASSADPVELALRFTERLFDTLQARRVGVVERTRTGGLELLGGMERIADGAKRLELDERDVEILERSSQGAHFVAGGDVRGEASLYALPLILQDRWLGGILLEVPASFDDSDRRFLDALASGMAVALDRARLLERERERQREEKERLEAEVTDLRRVVRGSRIAYRSAEMDALLASARKVARTDTTVLITGESGTGKEMIAHALHELSGRHERPLVVVDCGAIAPTLIESELFGHEKGAFTGAHTRKPGKLARAEGGTVFLDEIGDLPLDLQSKLLRFVQEKQFTPVGGVDSRQVDVRIIAATHVDLRARVAEGRFREDLFHRLNVIRLHVPPLRDRKGDIVHLATMFLQQFAALYRRPAHHFTPVAKAALEAHPWPGNVRELQNLVMTSVLFCDGPEVDVEDLQGFQSELQPGGASARPAGEAAAEQSPSAPAAGDPLARLREALAREVAAAVAAGPAGLLPLGKWLAEDLVLTADRMTGGAARRGAELLGLADTTYRRQLRGASARRASGAARRSASWPHVVSLLEDVIRGRPPGVDACEWAEAALLAEIEKAVTGDARKAATLLGVTEPTLLRRRASLPRQI